MKKRQDQRRKPFLNCHYCGKAIAPKDATYVKANTERNYHICGKCTAKIIQKGSP